MSDNINKGYYQPAIGTLAGFSVTPTPVDPISKTGWSIDQLRKFLQNEDDGSFPTVEWMQELEKLISEHMGDFDNPHRVTLDQIMENVTKDIVGNITPGTVPQAPPFFAYDAALALPLNNIFPATYSTINLYRRSDTGRYIDPATEVEVMGVDTSSGDPGIPLFNTVRNDIPSTWNTDPLLRINTVVTSVNHDAVNYPFNFLRVDETNATGDFGISLPVQETASKVYTLTVFLVPLYVDGYFLIRRPGDNQSVMRISTEDGTFTFDSNTVSGSVTKYLDGIFKVSYSYTAPNSDGLRRIEIVQQDADDPSSTRVGRAERMLFLAGQPIVANAAIGYPLPISPGLSASCQPFVPSLNRVGAPASLSNLTVSIALSLHVLPINATAVGSNLVTFGDLQLKRDATKVYLAYRNQTMFTSDILPGLNVFSFSLSPGLIAFKDLANPGQSIAGAYPALSTGTVSAGPCGGYLRRLAFYAQAEPISGLEFLTNG